MGASQWITDPHLRRGARLRLFCLPHAGGGTSVFQTWWSELPLSIALCPVHLPGREGRLAEPPFTSMVPLVEALANAIQPYLDLPSAVFGHSMGALVAFELARELRRRGERQPVHLSVAGLRPPHALDPNYPLHSSLSTSDLLHILRRMGGTPEAVLNNTEVLELMLPVLRADLAVCETYVYRPEEPLACSISAYGGLADATVSRADLEGWKQETCGPFSVVMLPGDHFFPRNTRGPLLAALGHDLERYLT